MGRRSRRSCPFEGVVSTRRLCAREANQPRDCRALCVSMPPGDCFTAMYWHVLLPNSRLHLTVVRGGPAFIPSAAGEPAPLGAHRGDEVWNLLLAIAILAGVKGWHRRDFRPLPLSTRSSAELRYRLAWRRAGGIAASVLSACSRSCARSGCHRVLAWVPARATAGQAREGQSCNRDGSVGSQPRRENREAWVTCRPIPPSSGRLPAGSACLRSPLISSVRPVTG